EYLVVKTTSSIKQALKKFEMSIRFGTSGWRAIITDEFTFAGFRAVRKGICAHFSPSRARFGYVAEARAWTGGVVGSVGPSHLVDRVAKLHRLPNYEKPVGFKYIGELINEDKIILGGEESVGLSFKGHYPQKDGILACLLAAKTVASRGASLTDQLNQL